MPVKSQIEIRGWLVVTDLSLQWCQIYGSVSAMGAALIRIFEAVGNQAQGGSK